ncbi:HU family DNA-binding protein, partial [Chromobacterium alticapitis]|uniref:HU family DNA-binding protein n=1 Tax=Chromobacterium alticapitis TaxID=2073169 RepID=UPI003F7189F0
GQWERRCYISSRKLSAEALAQAARAHWGIENPLAGQALSRPSRGLCKRCFPRLAPLSVCPKRHCKSIYNRILLFHLYQQGKIAENGGLHSSRKTHTMTKAELIAILSDKSGLNKADVLRVLGAFDEVLLDTLADNGELSIMAGKFKVKESAARTGRNPKTGETIQIPAKRKVAFVASKPLKDRIGG